MDETNPYAPPAAELEIASDPEAILPPFFAVSPLKLVVMSLATFSYYVIYWHYRQWKAISAADKVKRWAFVRAIFLGLTGFELYPKIEETTKAAGIRLRWAGWMLALSAIVINISTWFSGLLQHEVPLLQHAWVLAIVPPFIAQFAIQKLHAQVVPEAGGNARFTIWNILWLATGLLAWLGLAINHFSPSHPK